VPVFALLFRFEEKLADFLGMLQPSTHCHLELMVLSVDLFRQLVHAPDDCRRLEETVTIHKSNLLLAWLRFAKNKLSSAFSAD
jgi:hypothetical protein